MSSNEIKKSLRVARIIVVQSIYAYQAVKPEDYKNILNYRIQNYKDPDENDYEKEEIANIPLVDELYAYELFEFSITKEKEIKNIIDKFLLIGWTTQRMDSLLLSIIWSFTGDICINQRNNKSDNVIDDKVFISEYVKLTSGFFNDKECGFVNKTLDLMSSKKQFIFEELLNQ